MIRPLKLPGLTLSGNVLLAPLAGYTDAAFRSVCVSQGACFAFTEMISSEACFRKNPKTLDLLQKADNEEAYGIQIFAHEPGVAAASLQEIIRFKPALIDLNCGCSIPKILRSGCGAALLREPAKIAAIVRAMKNATEIPISIKIRSGWDQDSVNYLEIATLAREAGVSLITLHPRTRSQVFGGKADWQHLQELKKQLPEIPILGSGDLFTAADVKAMLEQTGCDGVMLARGAIGNPFLFRQVYQLIEHNILPQPTGAGEILELALQQLKIAIHYKGETRACKEMRKQFCAYSRGLAHSAPLRLQAVHASTYSEYEELIGGYLAQKQE